MHALATASPVALYLLLARYSEAEKLMMELTRCPKCHRRVIRIERRSRLVVYIHQQIQKYTFGCAVPEKRKRAA